MAHAFVKHPSQPATRSPDLQMRKVANSGVDELLILWQVKRACAHAGWAIYKEQHVLWALLLFLSQTVWAAGKTGQRVLDHVSD